MGILSEKIFRNLRNVYIILKGVSNGKLKAEIYAEARSSYIYILFSMLEQDGYLECKEERRGRLRTKRCVLTEKGNKLLEIIAKLIELDQVH